MKSGTPTSWVLFSKHEDCGAGGPVRAIGVPLALHIQVRIQAKERRVRGYVHLSSRQGHCLIKYHEHQIYSRFVEYSLASRVRGWDKEDERKIEQADKEVGSKRIKDECGRPGGGVSHSIDSPKRGHLRARRQN